MDPRYSMIGVFHETWKRVNARRTSQKVSYDRVINDLCDKAEKYEKMIQEQQ